MDDTYMEDNKYQGKGGLVVPYLLEKKYTLIEQSVHTPHSSFVLLH